MADQHRCTGCAEYDRMSRRGLFGVAGTFAVAAAMPGWLPRVVLAQSDDSARDVVVSIFLRGGVDGLTLCVPFHDEGYYDLRPGLAIAPPDSGGQDRAIALDDEFGLPPAMEPLVEAYESGDLLLVHACGLEDASRSHFDAMHSVETGQSKDGGSLFTGWLGRHLQVTAPTRQDAVLRAVGIGYGLQRTLVGAPLALPMRDPADFGFAGDPGTASARRKAIEAMFEVAGDPLEAAARNTVQTIDLLEAIDFAGYKPSGGAQYPDGEFGLALESTAALIKADIGVEAVAVDLGGWDTHDEQGPVGGWMAQLMGSLAAGLAAFHRDLFSGGRDDVALVAMSEFGRNARENGSRGTDHGTGGVMMALGGAVAGGRVLTDWPGLAPGQLFDGQDLAITTDYRDVISEILTKRAGNPDIEAVFPDKGYLPKDLGVIA